MSNELDRQKRTLAVLERLEPQAVDAQKNWLTIADTVRVSSAISLKRIADALEGLNGMADGAITRTIRKEW